MLLLNLEKLVEKRTEDLHTVNAVLTQSEARLKSVFENIPDLIWLKDTKGVYLACNQAFERFFAMDTEQIIGKTDDDSPHGLQADMIRAEDEKVIRDESPGMMEKWVRDVKTGKQVFFDVIKAPVRTQDGRLVGVLGITRAT